MQGGRSQFKNTLLHRNVKRFRGGFVIKAHRWLYHSTLGSRVIKKKMQGGTSGLIDFCITQRKAQGPSRTCNESKEEEDEVCRTRVDRSFSPHKLTDLNQNCQVVFFFLQGGTSGLVATLRSSSFHRALRSAPTRI